MKRNVAQLKAARRKDRDLFEGLLESVKQILPGIVYQCAVCDYALVSTTGNEHVKFLTCVDCSEIICSDCIKNWGDLVKSDHDDGMQIQCPVCAETAKHKADKGNSQTACAAGHNFTYDQQTLLRLYANARSPKQRKIAYLDQDRDIIVFEASSDSSEEES